jgi:beta-carotene 3-hydroxylase
MTWLLYIAILLGSFAMMEGVAWFTHKYVMHGFLWRLHKDHHRHGKGFFEWNDLFAVFFASIAIVLIVTGLPQADWRFWMGAGITLYGVAYFLAHDIIVHQRVKVLRNWKHPYVLALRRAHKVHHKTLGKHGAESFGFLVVPRKFLKQEQSRVV